MYVDVFVRAFCVCDIVLSSTVCLVARNSSSLVLVQYKLTKGAVSSVDAGFRVVGLGDVSWQRKSDWIDFVLIVVRCFSFHNHT